MKFSEVIKQAASLIQQNRRITYRSLKREFDLDDEALEDLKDELLFSHPDISEADGRGLVWNGAAEPASTIEPESVPLQSQSPASYTPQHLAERIRAEQQAMESRGASDGERKTITALFADLKGSTALIEGLDPEEARAIIDPALQLMMDAVHRYDGYVAQSLGDGIFALFGAPIAHEDHPQRALYAALRMQEEMRAYSDQSLLKGGIPLQMRVGINTGEVVVRSIRKDDLHTDYVPVGHSTNLAARMEQIATPGSIVISEYTRKLTEGYFELKALGAAEIKGVDEPLNVYDVQGAGPLRTRLQMSARRGLTRFVGRHSEMEQLQQAFNQAKAGQGQIVGVMGEPGLGKSRLFHEFKLVSQSDCFVLEAFAVSHGQSSPYLPLIELLRNYFQIEPTDDKRTQKEKINGKVLTLDRSLEESVPYLFALLGIEEPDSELSQMDPQIRRQRTFEALKKLFLRESLNQPLLLIFEDLHWIDNETQGFLDTLSESVASAQVLLLVNYRPEYKHEWGQKTYYTQLRLAPLGRAEAEEFLTFLLGTDGSLTSLKGLVLERTDGTPFFMEEVVQTLVEEGTLTGERGRYQLEAAPADLRISPTVQGVLAARIDRLTAGEKELLQHLSVIGRQFPASLVKQVVSQPEDELYRILASLQAKEFLYEQPAFPESEYIFKHALTQDVTYGTVLQEQRKALHERTGQAMETRYADQLEDHYGDLAHHYSQSENAGKAVEYLYLVGQQAVQRSANVEAATHLTTALSFIEKLPDGRERTEHEVRIQVALGVSLALTQGYTSLDIQHTYTRARELSRSIGDTANLFASMRGLFMMHAVRGELRTTLEYGKQMLQLAEEEQDESLQMEARADLGYAMLWTGEIREGRAHFNQSIRLYDPNQHASLRFVYGLDGGVYSRVQAAFASWLLGYPAQSQQALRDGFTLAQDLTHPPSLASAFAYSAGCQLICRNYRLAHEHAEAFHSLAVENEDAWWKAMSLCFRGRVLAAQEQSAEGIAQIQQGLEAFQDIWRVFVWQPFNLALLAEVYGKAGQAAEGLRAVADAFEVVNTTDERWYDAELYRLKGELTLQQSQDAAQAEACYQKALDVARQQEAKSWELRAATSFARLWQDQGKAREAREVLAPVYNWFTEGFDTQDLKDAKALLDGLA